MATKPSSQITPATALAQLLQEHPELPPVDWAIPRSLGLLKGELFADDHPFEVLRAYADVLGGSIRPDTRPECEFEADGLRRRVHRLTTTWRDVPVMVSATATVGLCDPRLLPAQLAEQRHLMDPAAPECWGVIA